MKVIQWNINGFKPRLKQLQLLLKKRNPSICLQETNFKNSNYAMLRNYQPRFKNRLNKNFACREVATYIKNHIYAEKILPPLAQLIFSFAAPILPTNLSGKPDDLYDSDHFPITLEFQNSNFI